MRITVDREADAAYLCLVDGIEPGDVAGTHVVDLPFGSASINVDLDSDGRVLGIEILGARRVLRASTIAAATDITRGS